MLWGGFDGRSLFLGLLWCLAVGSAFVFGAYQLHAGDVAERERQAKALQATVTASLELSKGNTKAVQGLLSSSPGPSAFVRLELANRAGKVWGVQFDDPSPAWLDLPWFDGRPRELPLETKYGRYVLHLIPAPTFSVQRLSAAAYLVLPLLVAVLCGIPLMSRRPPKWAEGRKIDDQRWTAVLMPRQHGQPALESAAKGVETPPAESIVDCLPMAILCCDWQGHITYSNEAAKTLLLHTGQSGEGLVFFDLVAPWERNRVRDLFARKRFGRTGELLETQVLVARGGVLAVSIDITDGPGSGGGLVLALRDVTDMRAAEQALDARTRLLDGISQGVAILAANRGGELLYCNQVFRELLRFPSEFDTGNVFLQCIAAFSDSTAATLRTALAQGVAARTRLSWQEDGGRSRWLALRLSPMALGYADETVLICELQDRTEETGFRSRVEEELTRQRHILGEMPLGLCVTDDAGQVREVNKHLLKLTGRVREQLLTGTTEDWLARDAWKQGAVIQGEHTIRGDSGDRMAKVTTLPLADVSGAGHVYLFEDITAYAQKAQEDAIERERLRQILDEIAVGIITTNTDGFIQYFNRHAQRLTNLTEHQYKGMPLAQIIHLIDEKKRQTLADPAMRAMRIGKTVRFRQDVLLVGENRHELAVEVSATPVRDRNRSVTGCVVVMWDVSEQRSMTQQMSLRASRDPLTGLVNRRELLSMLEAMQYEVDDQHKQHALCYMDLDKFKIINDVCGHNAGDELLRQVSDLMTQCLRANDILARIGGDEFCALLGNTTATSAVVVAEKIREAIKHFRFAWDGKYFDIGVSIGVFTLQPGFTVDETVSAADEACYMAKEKGRDLVWSASASPETGKQLSAPWNERLSVAMEHDYFRLFRQDALNLQASASAGQAYHQILLRLHEPGRTPLAASSFMPSAQRFNLTSAIERWVIGKLLASIASAGMGQGALAEVFAIQLSAATLSEPTFLPFLQEQSRLYRVPPPMLCFEINEDDLVQNFTTVRTFMLACTELGYRFCLNQFGAGISSFAYIRNLPLQFLKIDPSLTRQAEADAVDESIVRAIQDISRHMKILTMTQQVDNASSLENLRRLGVHYAQGLVVHEPVPLEPSAEAHALPLRGAAASHGRS